MNIAKPDPAVVDMQMPTPAVEQIRQPNIEVTPPSVPEIDNQIHVAPGVTPVNVQMAENASADIQQPIVDLRSPALHPNDFQNESISMPSQPVHRI